MFHYFHVTRPWKTWRHLILVLYVPIGVSLLLLRAGAADSIFFFFFFFFFFFGVCVSGCDNDGFDR